MGKPSNARRSARRPGKHERAQVKKPKRAKACLLVPGATIHVKAGKRKYSKIVNLLHTHLDGEVPSAKSGQAGKRPGYTSACISLTP